MATPLQVYLDSSDFSDLSNPRKLTPVLLSVRDDFQHLADSGDVEFRFSVAHVCEATPTVPDAVDAALRRASLMHALCGTNTLATVQEIRDAELEGKGPYSPLTQSRWYPPLGDLLPASPIGDLRAMLREELKTTGLTRAERRRKEREVIGKKGLTEAAKRHLRDSPPTDMPEFLRVLPFTTPELAALTSYVQGGPGREVVVSACQRVLANPTWIMSRHAEDSQKLSGITEWLRKGGSDFFVNVGDAVSQVQVFRRRMDEANHQVVASMAAITDAEVREQLLVDHRSSQQALGRRINNDRRRWEESVLRSMTGQTTEVGSCMTFEEVQSTYPGIAASLAAAMHAIRRATESEQPRPLKESDFGDAMHAVYAPYVDIYRTDAFMADGIARMLKSRGTMVARNLLKLPDEIRARLVCGRPAV